MRDISMVETVEISDFSTIEKIGDWENSRAVALVSPGFLVPTDSEVAVFLEQENIAGLNIKRDEQAMVLAEDGIEQAAEDLVEVDRICSNLFEDLPKLDFGLSMGGALLSRYRSVSETTPAVSVWISTVIDAGFVWDRYLKKMMQAFPDGGHASNRVFLDALRADVLAAKPNCPSLLGLETQDSRTQLESVNQLMESHPGAYQLERINMKHVRFPEQAQAVVRDFINQTLTLRMAAE